MKTLKTKLSEKCKKIQLKIDYRYLSERSLNSHIHCRRVCVRLQKLNTIR